MCLGPAVSPVFWFLFVLVWLLGIPFGFFLIAHYDGWRGAIQFLPFGAPIGVIAAIVWSIFWAYLLHIVFPTRISSEGVAAYSVWGTRRFIAWQQIAMVCPIRILNLRYLRLYSSTDRRVTWLPLFSADPDAFHAALHETLPSDSPILAHIK